MIDDNQLEAIRQRMDSNDIPALVDEINRTRSIGWIGKTIAYLAFLALIFLMFSLATGVLAVAVKLMCLSTGALR